jgi:hypothetical protein
VSVARQHLQARIDEYAASEIRFNLLALVKSRLLTAQQGVQRLLGRLQSVYDALEAADAAGDAAPPSALAVAAGVDPSLVPELTLPVVAAAAADVPRLTAEYSDLQGALSRAATELER